MHDLITKKLSKHFLNKSYGMLKFPNARSERAIVQVEKIFTLTECTFGYTEISYNLLLHAIS